MSRRRPGGSAGPVADGRLVVPVGRTFPLDEVAAAYDHCAAGGKVGKVVLLP